MCIVNVAKEIANPMTETGNGVTAVLKADGTVWTLRKQSIWSMWKWKKSRKFRGNYNK